MCAGGAEGSKKEEPEIFGRTARGPPATDFRQISGFRYSIGSPAPPSDSHRSRIELDMIRYDIDEQKIGRYDFDS